MPRYFYDCGLRAAYMAKQYDMKFEDGFSAQFLALDAAAQIRDKSERGPYYIHPDSLHLLAPQVGDLIGDGVTFGLNGGDGCISVPERRNGKHHYKLPDGPHIIQRDGEAFFWPEVEA